MKMGNININGQTFDYQTGDTILSVCNKNDIYIPTMCHMQGDDHGASCMVCMVQDVDSGKLLPACSTSAGTVQNIETRNEEVFTSRKIALELLLSDHIGHCEAPCTMTCPAHMNIPLMNRLIAAGEYGKAIRVVKKDIALPGILGYICPAPCEKACIRQQHDETVSICVLKRFVAEEDYDQPWIPAKSVAKNKKVAIVGTGPLGLAAAYYLLLDGYACTLFDKNDKIGGMLRYGALKHDLPEHVLDQDIAPIISLGAQFELGKEINETDFHQLRKEYDAVVLGPGDISEQVGESFWGMAVTKNGIKANPNTYETSLPGVFAGGSSLRPQQIAIRAAAHGKGIAHSIAQYLEGHKVTGEPRLFNSTFKGAHTREIDELMKDALDIARVANVDNKGYSKEEAAKEAQRCMHCDCRKPVSCSLRTYAQEYEANQKRFWSDDRKLLERNTQHKNVIYEPQKCIKCSICVRTTAQYEERAGLTYIGRGFDLRIGSPMNEDMSTALTSAAEACVANCPTGAISFKEAEERLPTVK